MTVNNLTFEHRFAMLLDVLVLVLVDKALPAFLLLPCLGLGLLTRRKGGRMSYKSYC
jgi:hypothetical protein